MISPGMNISTFHQWRKELVEHRSGAFPGSGDQSALEEENRRLKRDLERTRQDHELVRVLPPAAFVSLLLAVVRRSLTN